MRICFYNPQALTCNALGTSLFALVTEFGKAATNKRRFDFLLEVLRDRKYDSAIVVDGTVSSLPWHRLGPIFRSRYFIKSFSFFEVYLWCFLNGVNPLRRKIIFSLDGLDPERDVLFGFMATGKTFLDPVLTERSFFKAFSGKKVLHTTHFYERTARLATTVRATGVRAMIGEANLKDSPYFSMHFDYIDDVYIVPFVLRKRYVSTSAFISRKNKCVALGTLMLFPSNHQPTKDHYAYFGVNALHPMRKTIAKNIDSLTNVIDSRMITVEQATVKKRKKWYAALWSKIVHPVGQPYHAFDIVETFNAYRMFVASEENIGLPSINSVEGMACGCAYIGLESPMYADLGMISGVHYVGYDGTLDGLVSKIAYYQGHEQELLAIADAGKRFVQKTFTEENAIRSFIGACEALKNDGR